MKVFIHMMDSPLYLVFPFSLLLILGLWFLWKSRRVFTLNSSTAVPCPEHSDEMFPDSLGEEEKELIRNIIEFQDGMVCEIMVPRIDMVAIEERTLLKEFRLLALEKGHSRIPVYRANIDQITGIAYVKDMLRYWDADENTITVAEFMRPAYFVPETKDINSLLQEFQTKKVHMAVAIDEYGGTAGIVTIEDILEEVFGDIVDEHDEEEEELITIINEHMIEVDAKADIDELEEYVGEIAVEQQDFETVGGLLLSLLGDIPQEQEIVEFRNLKFTILSTDRHRIVRVRIERMPEATNVNSPQE